MRTKLHHNLMQEINPGAKTLLGLVAAAAPHDSFAAPARAPRVTHAGGDVKDAVGGRSAKKGKKKGKKVGGRCGRWPTRPVATPTK